MKTILLLLLRCSIIGLLCFLGIKSFGMNPNFIISLNYGLNKETGNVSQYSSKHVADSTQVETEYRNVQFLNFELKTENNQVMVLWESGSEINNSYFTIERSINGTDWETIGTVTGAGNSSVSVGYTYKDNNPVDGISYYHIKQTDNNGVSTFSEIKAIELMLSVGELHVFPNPATAMVTINLAKHVDEDAVVSLLSAEGLSIRELTTVASEITIDIEYLEPGIYFVRIQTTKKTEIKKLIKTNRNNQ